MKRKGLFSLWLTTMGCFVGGFVLPAFCTVVINFFGRYYLTHGGDLGNFSEVVFRPDIVEVYFRLAILGAIVGTIAWTNVWLTK